MNYFDFSDLMEPEDAKSFPENCELLREAAERFHRKISLDNSMDLRARAKELINRRMR